MWFCFLSISGWVFPSSGAGVGVGMLRGAGDSFICKYKLCNVLFPQLYAFVHVCCLFSIVRYYVICISYQFVRVHVCSVHRCRVPFCFAFLFRIVHIHMFRFQRCLFVYSFRLGLFGFSDVSCLTSSFSDVRFQSFLFNIVLFRFIVFQMLPAQKCPCSDVSFSDQFSVISFP